MLGRWTSDQVNTCWRSSWRGCTWRCPVARSVPEAGRRLFRLRGTARRPAWSPLGGAVSSIGRTLAVRTGLVLRSCICAPNIRCASGYARLNLCRRTVLIDLAFGFAGGLAGCGWFLAFGDRSFARVGGGRATVLRSRFACRLSGGLSTWGGLCLGHRWLAGGIRVWLSRFGVGWGTSLSLQCHPPCNAAMLSMFRSLLCLLGSAGAATTTPGGAVATARSREPADWGTLVAMDGLGSERAPNPSKSSQGYR